MFGKNFEAETKTDDNKGDEINDINFALLSIWVWAGLGGGGREMWGDARRDDRPPSPWPDYVPACPLDTPSPNTYSHRTAAFLSLSLPPSSQPACWLLLLLLLQRCHDLNSISSQLTTDAFLDLNLCLFSFPDVPTLADESECSHVS